jgi:hypothetical protein
VQSRVTTVATRHTYQVAPSVHVSFNLIVGGQSLYNAYDCLLVQCPFDFSYFPFDVHHCSLRMSSKFMHIDTKTYETLKFRDVSGRMQPNVGYSIAYNIFKRTEDMTQTSPTSGHIYSTAGFHITLSRDISYSVVNTFLPSLLIVLTSFIRGATIHLYTRSVSLQSTKPTHHPTPKPRPKIHKYTFYYLRYQHVLVFKTI